MRKWRVQPLVVCVLLLSFVLPISSVTAESVGKNCSKAGVIAGTKKNPLVCKKVGKKLLWRPLNLSVEDTNEVAGIKSVKILWNQPPKFGGQQFSFDFELACGKVMSLDGPQRYPEVRVSYFTNPAPPVEIWSKYGEMRMVGLPTLSKGGNTATYHYVGVSPMVNGAPVQIWVWVKDVNVPTCTPAVGEFRAAIMSEKFIVQLTADTATTVATTTTLAPLPVSPQRVTWKTGGTLNFRIGVTYVFALCLSGDGGTLSYLEVLTTATGWTTKVVGQTYIDNTKCSDPKFPFVLEWTWKVTETAGQASKMRITPWGQEMNIIIS